MSQLKTALRRLVNIVQRRMVPKDARYLVVARDVNGDKARRLIGRIVFYAPNATFAVVPRVSVTDVLTAAAIVEADEGLVPPALRWRLENVFKADFERYHLDGWELSRLAEQVDGLPTAQRRREAHGRLRAAVSSLREQRKPVAYVFGTGSSLERASQRDFSDGYRIVCNTIVRDKSLWDHLLPDFLVAGDAIYHFGHTPHARAFRADARLRIAEAGGRTLFVYPELFDAVVRREFVGLESVLVPVPMAPHDRIDVDLVAEFGLPSLGNVLNVLLLPLGCTLARTVKLWGFDGRAPDDKSFWANSNKQSYPELMDGLRAEHPAFFSTLVPAGRETEYVKNVHGDALERRLQRAEANGFQFVMMHFSWTETLNRRASPQSGDSAP